MKNVMMYQSQTNKSLLLGLLLAAALAGCSSKAVKEEPPAKVEEKSPMVSKEEAPAPRVEAPAMTAPATTPEVAYNPLKDPNNILFKRSIYFDFDKDEVKAEFRPLIEAHAKYMLEHPSAKVYLQGNADERGSREYNLSLGQRRSVSVKKVVNLLGVQDTQIETVSFGEEKATGAHDKDRRVDIVYDGE